MAVTEWRISREALLTWAQYVMPVYLTFLPLSVLLNGLIIAVTFKSTRLRSNCNILIACQAFTDICKLSSLIYTCVNIYSNRLVSYFDCFIYQAVPLVAVNCSSLLMLLIGIDRYISVMHSVWYNSLKRFTYFSFHILFCLVHCVAVIIAQYMSLSYEPSVICFLTSVLNDSVKDWWSASQVVVCVVVVVIYLRLHRFLKTIQCDVETRRTIKALTLVVMAYLFGWATSVGLLCFSRILISDTNLEQAAELGLGFFAGIYLCIPCAVYYTQSSVYRKEIRSLLGMKIEVLDAGSVPRHMS